MSSDDDFDDSDFNFTAEELNDIDSAIAATLSSEAATSSSPVPASNAPSHTIVPHIATASTSSSRIGYVTEMESRDLSDSSFADEVFQDPQFLNALDESLTRMERQHVSTSGMNPQINPPHPTLLYADGGSVAGGNQFHQHAQGRSARAAIERGSGFICPKRKSRQHPATHASKCMKYASERAENSSSAPSSPSVKPNAGAESEPPRPSVSQQKVDAMLEGYDELLTCTICSEYYVYPCSVIPCGHTFCAPCISEWLATPVQRRKPSCPTCRSSCQSTVPSFIVGNFVEKHVDALASNGAEEWASAQSSDRSLSRPGASREDWERRRREWKSRESKKKSGLATVQNGQGSPRLAARVIQVFIDINSEYEGREDGLSSSDDNDDDSREGEVLDTS